MIKGEGKVKILLTAMECRLCDGLIQVLLVALGLALIVHLFVGGGRGYAERGGGDRKERRRVVTFGRNKARQIRG